MKAYLGFDLGGTNLRGALVDPEGVVLIEERSPVGDDRSPEAICGRLGEAVERLAARGRSERGVDVDGVGIGVAAWIDKSTGRVRRAPNLGWVDVDLASLVSRHLGEEVVLVNDLTAVTYGEWQAGAARGERDVLCLFVGSGLGAGLVLDGKLYEGASGVAGELGHIVFDDSDDAAECGCGRRGCVEAYVGGRYLETTVRAATSAPGPRRYAGAVAAGAAEGRGPAELICTDVEAAAEAGDIDSLALWTKAAQALGHAIALGVQLLDPAVVVLGGGVMEFAPALRVAAVKAFERRTAPGLRISVQIRRPALGGAAGAIGAALLARDRRGP